MLAIGTRVVVVNYDYEEDDLSVNGQEGTVVKGEGDYVYVDLDDKEFNKKFMGTSEWTYLFLPHEVKAI